MSKIVGVTACPTGIAHTYMAAESLERAAKEAGHEIKIETQGTKTENVLTMEEINQADVVILACGKNIDLSRFTGKKVLTVSPGQAIKNGKQVIDDAIAGNQIIIQKTTKKNQSPTTKLGIYAHLMAGVNFMLPFVIAGGILIAISFAFGINAATPDDPSYSIWAAAFSEIGGRVSFGLMVPVLAAGISYSIADRQGIAPGMVVGMLATIDGSGFIGGIIGGLLAGYFTAFITQKINLPKSINALGQLIIIPLVSITVVGFAMKFIIGAPVAHLLSFLTNWLNSLGTTHGALFGILIGVMMASDMGGPLNKSICTFALGLMSSGIYGPIAACMVAGMTPPLGLAIATIIFKNKFTPEEKEAGKSCWILGASFITEGAIPFAVADPFRVIPSLMLGSAVAAAMSLGFGCASLAPHGGIWVMAIPGVITNLLMYIVALLAGSIVTAIAVGLMKKPVALANE